MCAITSWVTVFGQDSRFVQTLRAILRLHSAIANAASGGLSLEDSAPVVFPLHPSHYPHRRLATPTVSSSLMTLLERWFSATSSTDQRQLVDWPTAWSKTEVIRTRRHSDCYTRVTLKDKLAGKAASVLHLYDAIREALTYPHQQMRDTGVSVVRYH